jgi:hypothetical protein
MLKNRASPFIPLRLGKDLVDDDLESPSSEVEEDHNTQAITKIQAKWRAFLS